MAPRVLALALALITTVELMPMCGYAQSSDCTSTIVSLSSCLNYITGSTDTPSVPCCTQLAKVVQSAPRCLCIILNGGASQFGVIINQTRALALPGACNVQTPPVSRCKEIDSPAPTPGRESATPGGVSGGSFLQPVAALHPALFFAALILLTFLECLP